MSVSSVSPSLVSVHETFQTSHGDRAAPAVADAGVCSTLAGIAAGVVTGIEDGVSATVSFSGKALHALEQAGEAAVGDVEELAIGAWHGLEHGAQAVEDIGQAVGSVVASGAHEIARTAWSAGKELGHYAQVGLSATGTAISEVASGTVMAASAGGRGLIAML